MAAWICHINNYLGLNTGDKPSLLAKDQNLYFLMANQATSLD